MESRGGGGGGVALLIGLSEAVAESGSGVEAPQHSCGKRKQTC